MFLATFWFSLMNLFVKLLQHLPTFELVFFRCAIATVISFVLICRKGMDWWGSNRLLLVLRGIFGTTALFTFFYTLQKMPMGTAVTLQYTSPVFTALFAVFLLRERVHPLQWLFFIVSMSGVFLVRGVDSEISWFLIATGLFSAIFSALAYNMVRTLSGKEHPLVVVLHFQLLGALAGGAVSIFQWEMPVPGDWPGLILIGVFTQLGQYCLTRSLQSERVATVSIINYSGIGYALLFGWLFFGETYAPVQMAGMVLVIAGMVMNLLFTSRSHGTA